LSKYDSGEYKVALDAEYGNSKLDVFLEFVDAIEGYYGYKPVIYTANWWWSKGKTLRDVSSYPLWVASYTSKPIIPLGWQNCAIWQYTSNGKVNGITENTVDMNNIYDLDAIKLKVGGGTMATDYTKRRTATVTGFDYANVRYSTSQTSSLLRRINKGQQVVVNSGNPINGYVPISLRGVANSQEANNLNIAPELPAFVYESLLTYNQETLPVPPVPNPVTPPNPDPTPNPVPTPTPVDPPKQQTPLQKYGAKSWIGMHDFPQSELWIDPNKRGWVVHTMRYGEQYPDDIALNHRKYGGKVCARFNWNYGETLPRDENQIKNFAQWVRGEVARAKGQIDAVQIGNEPDIELQGVNPSYIGRVHNAVGAAVKEVNKDVLISPAPIGNLFIPVGFNHPRDYFLAIWNSIESQYKTLAVLHVYRHGKNGDPNQKFGDARVSDLFYNERNLENQLSYLGIAGMRDIPVLIGETNYDAPESDNLPDAWQDEVNVRAFVDMAIYFSKFKPYIIGVCPFRWNKDTINGRSYGIIGKGNVLWQMHEAQVQTN
jgi:hypothetical protein